MRFDRHKHHRRSIRLRGYDYSRPGAYFVTICTYGRECVLGDVAAGAVRLNERGLIAREEWLRSAHARYEIELNAFVVMPNHLRAIVLIKDTGATGPDVGASDPVGATGPEVGAQGLAPLHNTPLRRPSRSLGSFIAGFKMAVTKRINTLRGTPGARVWQRNYYERVLRDDDELARARGYIADNPGRWAEDDYYREHKEGGPVA
jgi:putative transposase